MPPRSQKDDGRKKLGQAFSRFLGRSRSQAPPPSPVPVPETAPPVPTPAPAPTIVSPSVQPPAPAPVPTTIPTATPQPTTSSHDPGSVSSVPAALSSVVGKVDAKIRAQSPSPKPPISSLTSTPVPPAPSPVPTTIPTAPQPSTPSHDPGSVSSTPAAPSSVVGKVDAKIRARRPSPKPPISPPTSTPVPPALKQISEATRAEAENFKICGDRAANSGEFQEAVHEYSRAIQLQPSNAEYLANRSYAYFAMSRYHDSLADAQASVAAKPTYSNGWRKLGAAHKALRQYAEAKIAYAEALRTQKSMLVAETIARELAQVTRLWEETSTSRSAATRPSVTANTSTPRPLISRSVLPRPAPPAPIPSRTTLLVSPPTSSTSSFSPPARPATATGPQISPHVVNASTNQARPLSPQSSVSVSQEPSASITPARSVPMPSTSRTAARPSTPAIPSVGVATSSESTRKAEHHKTLGNEAVASKDFQKAVDQYTRAIQLDPSSAVYLANRSYAYMALSKYEDARIDAEKAVVADPTYWKGWARLGAAHKALEKYSEAKTAFEQALMLGPATGAEVTRVDLAEVTRLLEPRIAVNSSLTSRPAADTPSVISPTVTATTTNSPSPRAPASVHSQTSVSPPTPLSSTFTPPRSAPSSQARRPTPAGPAPPPPRSIPVSASQDSTPRPAPPTQPIAITDPPADPPPAYRPGEISSPDPVVAAVAGQELDRELDELERKIAVRNAGALSFGSISLSGFISFFVSLTGRETQYTWDKDLDLVKIAHPAFALYHSDELKGSTLHQFDAELHRKFAGLVPGTVSITGYSELIAEHIRTTNPRNVTTLSSTGTLPFVSGKQLLARIDRLRIGLDFTDQEASAALRQLLGPDRTMWLNPADRFKLSNQITDICMALNRRDIFKDFSNTSSVALLALTPPPTGMGTWNFVYQIVLGYELHLRLEKESGGWYSGVNDKVSTNMLISKQWINNVDMFTEGGDSNLKMRSRVQARQIEGLLRFAEIMKWPHLSEMRDYVENAYVDLVGGKTVKVDLWDWLFGIMLPGKFYASKIMSVLVTATPSLSSHGAMPYVNSGFNLQGRSWWRCRNVLGSVLAGVRGVKSVCGWIGPCPGVTEPPRNPWIRIRARPVEFLRGTATDPLGDIDDASDDGSEEEDYDTSRRLFSPRAGETVFDVIRDLSDMSLWNEPVPPPKVNLSCSVSKIALKALPLETTGSIDPNDARTEYQASIKFQFAGITGTSDVTYTLYTNPTFISAHPCVGTHVVHRREMFRYTGNVVAVKDLKSYEGGGGSRVLVINAQCDGGEAAARAWCAERGKHAVIRRGKGTCFTCSVSMAGREGLGVGVLIWS